MKTLEGWIFDIHLSRCAVVIRAIDTDGHTHTLSDTFIPVFYISGDSKDLRALARFVMDQPWDVRLARTKLSDATFKQPIVVLQVEVMNPHHFSTIVERVMWARPKLKCYNGHIPVLQQYSIARNIVPFALCHFVVDDEQRILGFEVIASTRKNSRQERAALWKTKKRT